MRTVAKALRRQPILRPETVVGLVIELASEADPSDLLHLGEREIVIKWFSSTELGEINVHVSLSAADYLLALEAHRAGRPVMVSGTLEKHGRPWVLSNPTAFGVT
jgi:hypothetical protein